MEAEQREHERLDTYVLGLRRERAAVELQIAQLRGMRPDARWWSGWEKQEGEPPSVAERIERAEARVSSINAEIMRIAGDAIGLK